MSSINHELGLSKINIKEFKNLKHFILNLVSEYEDRLKINHEQKEITLESLRELEGKLTSINRIRQNNANLFSPNVKTEDINEVSMQIKCMNEKINLLVEEREKVELSLNNFKELLKCVNSKDMPQKEIGLNILSAQEQDRQRIARDLHDSTVQNLTGLVHKVDLCTRLVDIDSTRAKLELASMSNTVKSVINEMREIIYNLKPMSLDDLGLIVTVERFAKQLMVNNDVKVILKHNQETEGILPVINLSLFRVIQEACNNVVKHTKASKIDININYQEDRIVIIIKDDGYGFDVEKQKDVIPDRMSGYGLSIMKERIYLLSGTLKIQSDNKIGTIITVTVPLINRKGDEDE